jgi:hypothetical protein
LFSCVVFSCENLLYSNDLCVQTTNIPSFVSWGLFFALLLLESSKQTYLPSLWLLFFCL